jgi:DNA ligase-associated metallophosphoesterase
MTITIRDTPIQLLAERAVFLPHQKMLVIADLHLGKLVHFRRKGLFIPKGEVNEDLVLFERLINAHQPEEVVFLGDLFHSETNSDFQAFTNTISRFPEVRFTLTKGNHDIIPSALFTQIKMQVVNEVQLPRSISLCHQLPKTPAADHFYITGHIHPGYLLHGKARQTYRLPCFHQNSNCLTLPAFGKHTGLYFPEYQSGDLCFVVLGDQVLEVRI